MATVEYCDRCGALVGSAPTFAEAEDAREIARAAHVEESPVVPDERAQVASIGMRVDAYRKNMPPEGWVLCEDCARGLVRYMRRYGDDG